MVGKEGLHPGSALMDKGNQGENIVSLALLQEMKVEDKMIWYKPGQGSNTFDVNNREFSPLGEIQLFWKFHFAPSSTLRLAKFQVARAPLSPPVIFSVLYMLQQNLDHDLEPNALPLLRRTNKHGREGKLV